MQQAGFAASLLEAAAQFDAGQTGQGATQPVVVARGANGQGDVTAVG
jgi:hypothetical protein